MVSLPRTSAPRNTLKSLVFRYGSLRRLRNRLRLLPPPMSKDALAYAVGAEGLAGNHLRPERTRHSENLPAGEAGFANGERSWR